MPSVSTQSGQDPAPEYAKPSPQVATPDEQPVPPSMDNAQPPGAPLDSATRTPEPSGAQPSAPPATPGPNTATPPTESPADALEPIEKIAAVYPDEALRSGAVGIVLVLATVSPSGNVVNVVPKNGNPMLTPSAQAAAYKWKFAPYPARADGMMREIVLTFDFGE